MYKEIGAPVLQIICLVAGLFKNVVRFHLRYTNLIQLLPTVKCNGPSLGA